MKTDRLSVLSGFVLALLGGCLPLSLIAQDVRVHVGNVSTTQFLLIYETGEFAEYSLRVFDAADGGNDLTESLRVEYFPLHTGDVVIPGGAFEDRLTRYGLQESIMSRGMVVVGVRGAVPGQTYYAELSLPGSDGNGALLPLPRIAVTTAQRTAFVAESRQLLVQLSIPDSTTDGAIIRLAHADAAYPLFAVVGDAGAEGAAYFDLSHLLGADGAENLILTTGTQFDLTVLGMADAGIRATVPYANTFRVAAAASVTFAVGAEQGPWTLTLVADPERAGSVIGAGEFSHASTVPIEAVAARNWRFTGWLGEGITDPSSAQTQILMTADRTATATFALSEEVETYQSWRERIFLENAANEAMAGPERDPNASGFANLLEYTFGNHPVLLEEDRREPRVESTANGFQMVYYRRVNNPFLRVDLVTSQSLQGESWQVYEPGAGDITVTALDAEIEQVVVRLPAAVNGAPSFYRLLVQLDE